MTSEYKQFIEYVYSFYNENDGVHVIKGLNKEMVQDALYLYLHNPDNNKAYKWGGGDSFDREHVRDIILKRIKDGTKCL